MKMSRDTDVLIGPLPAFAPVGYAAQSRITLSKSANQREKKAERNLSVELTPAKVMQFKERRI